MINISAEMGLDSVPSAAPVRLDASAEIGLADVMAAMPSLTPVLSQMPQQVPLRLRALASGTMARLAVDTLTASMQRIFAVSVSGEASDITAPDGLKADLALNGSLSDPGPLRRMVKGVRIPPLSLRGTATADRGAYAARLTAHTGAGRLALDGRYSGSAPDYSVSIKADSLPVGAFMPDLGRRIKPDRSRRWHGVKPHFG